eukprot:GSMAST32.ASY1.ANO1.348.1 assembled CDS
MDTLQFLDLQVQEIFVPLLQNTANQEEWSSMIAKNVMEDTHKFAGDLQVTNYIQKKNDMDQNKSSPSHKNSTNSNTYNENISNSGFLLSKEPPKKLKGMDKKEMLHLVEGCVIRWTKLMQIVVHPEDAFNDLDNPHPGPLTELYFWRDKAVNLNSIFVQLQSSRIRKVLRFMDDAKSTYNSSFAKLCKSVFKSRAEANDNARFLSPLKKWFSIMETSNFSELSSYFRPVVHVLLLIWKNSRCYNTPPRMVVIVKQICNMIIEKATIFLDVTNLFDMLENRMEHKAIDDIKKTIKICGTFKSDYFAYKARSMVECPRNPWIMNNSALFTRLDDFLERCHDVLDLVQAVAQFSELAEIQIGGSRGNTLSTSVHQIYLDFQSKINSTKSGEQSSSAVASSDLLNVDGGSFDDTFYIFRTTVKELEQRLGCVLTKSFEDTNTIMSKFKLLQCFSMLLSRPVIETEMETNYIELLNSYHADLRLVNTIFFDKRLSPPVENNYPPIAGALAWSKGLLNRIERPMTQLRQLRGKLLDRDEALNLVKLYSNLVASISEFENKYYVCDDDDVDTDSIYGHGGNGVKRNLKNLFVNFDPALVEILREIKYFLLLGLSVPSAAMQIHQKAEIFRRQTSNLQLVANMYNMMQKTLLPVERPLVAAALSKVDRELEAGLVTLNWKSAAIDDFISQSMDQTSECNDVVHKMKTNLRLTQEILDEWSLEPLFQHGNKPATVTEFNDEYDVYLLQRYGFIRKGGKRIHFLIRETNKKLKVSTGLGDWKAYVDFINAVVYSGLCKLATVSLKYLSDQLSSQQLLSQEKYPLLEIEMDLYGDDIAFLPSIHSNKERNGILNIVLEWVEGFLVIGKRVKRLDSSVENASFIKGMSQDPGIRHLICDISDSVEQARVKCYHFRDKFQKYQYLWETDSIHLFNEFLKSATKEHINTENVQSISTPKNTEKLVMKLLDLEQFDERIIGLRAKASEIEKLEDRRDVYFLRVNAQPIKQALATFIAKWIMNYTSYLYDYVLTKLQSMCDFMVRSHRGLAIDVPDDDEPLLVATMRHIRNVRRSMAETSRMFEPLRNCVELLSKHGVNFCDESITSRGENEYLTIVPHEWDDTLERKMKIFSSQLDDFNNEMYKKAPFDESADTCTAQTAYETIHAYHTHILELEEQSEELLELADLFELPVSSFAALEQSRTDIGLLKQCWDISEMVKCFASNWSVLRWENIDSSEVIDIVSFIQEQLKGLPKHVNDWKVFKQVSMKLHEVGNKVNTLSEALELELHRRSDDVCEIVDLAKKEQNIDSELLNIEQVWEVAELEFVKYKGSNVFTLNVTTEQIECLEEHQMQLQGMITTTMILWNQLSMKWISLQPIFTSSGDIQTQLPEQTSIFETEPNIVQACRDMLAKLEGCEKALEDYLDVKKNKFPRFYFLSNDVLLEILSNASDPSRVAEHLPACFTGIAGLLLDITIERPPAARTLEMNAKRATAILEDRETIELQRSLKLSGAPESWLKSLDDLSKITLKDVLMKSHEKAASWDVDMSRQDWLFKFPAQIVLLAAQVYWTMETESVLDELEAGQDDSATNYLEIFLGDLSLQNVHNRDIIQKICDYKPENANDFLWQSQLRIYCRMESRQVTCNLFITPLTDRCYITLTMALQLTLGGAPAGPAGTGKTETTKDLARALGLPCMVFNCSDQMSYISIGGIFKGLSQCGAWGCFDEFNRIPIEVLSVVATQIQYYYQTQKQENRHMQIFDFTDGTRVKLVPTVGFFITMNPGYEGRTELPENVKTHFRSCAMIRPDLAPICENMLMAEEQLLSKQHHYDWGLRAVKCILQVAGRLKREAENESFALVSDIFPRVDASAKENPELMRAFFDKVGQLDELLKVRHSVVVMGPPGSGKTEIWKCLAHSFGHNKKKNVRHCVYETINPKAVQSHELYGYISRTGDWEDGALSNVIRNIIRNKWVILDGDIDALWIESMNTVMDDNKVLTLVSNERIPVTSSMRLILETENMNNATPATVSRVGILYINAEDVGCSLKCDDDKEYLTILCDRYILPILKMIKDNKLKPCVALSELNMVTTLCSILDALFATYPFDMINKDVLESMFLFACMLKFSELWLETFSEYKITKFKLRQGAETIFDFFFKWKSEVPDFSPSGDLNDEIFSEIVVPTVDNCRLNYLLSLLVESLKSDTMISSVVNLNFYTTSLSLQRTLESKLDKRSGSTYGPPASKQMLYFIDDLNMPQVEKYGTQTPCALLRQWMDYQSWYDRDDLKLKKNIVNIQFMCGMNPKAGSFFVNPRLQRHFAIIATELPAESDLMSIYGQILDISLTENNVNNDVRSMGNVILGALFKLVKSVQVRFLASAVKFHYNFSMREISSVVEGLCLATPKHISSPASFVRLYLHECYRVFSDRMIDEYDTKQFYLLLVEHTRQKFDEMNQEILQAEPLIFTSFIKKQGSKEKMLYAPISSGKSGWIELDSSLKKLLSNYNDRNNIMDIVPRGNALLVAFICGYKIFQLKYLKKIYFKAAIKPAVPLVFLITDSQITDEKFLLEDLFSNLRPAAKAAMVKDTSNLHVVLGFSPMGPKFRTRARQFPGIISCTTMDWFHPWSSNALVKKDAKSEEAKMRVLYYTQQRRHNYVTPSSFLELIKSYTALLTDKEHRLAVGLNTLAETEKNVRILREDLRKNMDIVTEKREKVEVLLTDMGQQKNEATELLASMDTIKTVAAEQARRAGEIENKSIVELAAAKPAMDAAKKAVSDLGQGQENDGQTFSGDSIPQKSEAAANLCNWVVNIPLMNELKSAQEKKRKADRDLNMAKNQVNRLSLATRLTSGLSDEKDRWSKDVENLKQSALSLVGDCILGAAFVSYIGAFDGPFREILLKQKWLPDLLSRDIPLTENISPVNILSTAAVRAEWSQQGLKADQMSLQNGAIITNCQRWPLLIDPQMQGISWLKNRGTHVLLQFTQKRWLSKLTTCISNGTTVIIEGVEDQIDLAMTPVTAQCTVINCIVTSEGLEEQLMAAVLLALENDLLESLIEGLEETKATAVEVEDALQEGKKTEAGINNAREVYRIVANEGSSLFFLISRLHRVNHMYRYSLNSFMGLQLNELDEEEKAERVLDIRENVRLIIFNWINRGLFQRDQFTFLTLLFIQLLNAGIIGTDCGFSAEGLHEENEASEALSQWLPESALNSIEELSKMSTFEGLRNDMEENSTRFKEWYNKISPEREKLPSRWRSLDGKLFQKLLVLRCLRPDRIQSAITDLIMEFLPTDAELIDIVNAIDRFAGTKGRIPGKTYFNISLGQGQGKSAIRKLDDAIASGHWVLLNNIHLMPSWLEKLEKKFVDATKFGSSNDFRLFLSSDQSESIPVALLCRSIKLSNEPPSGLKANLSRSFRGFSKEDLDNMDNATRGILFMSMLRHYMEAGANKLPWRDLRYIFGEIMYGGHIVNEFDRKLCNTYLLYFIQPKCLDELELVPYLTPRPTTYANYLNHIESIPAETPYAFGLHSNAAIGFRTTQCENLFKRILDLRPKETKKNNIDNSSKSTMQDILDIYRDSLPLFPIEDLPKEISPFSQVFFQECVQLTMTSTMDKMIEDLYNNDVPNRWKVLAYASLRSLTGWIVDLNKRIEILHKIVDSNLELPPVTWLPGLFSPQSFLTAILQRSAKKSHRELDKLGIDTIIMKRQPADISKVSRDGAYVFGLVLQGARWDQSAASLASSKPKEMFCELPVINLKAGLKSAIESKGNMYHCPVYRTKNRGSSYVFTANLRSKLPAGKWTLASVVMLMDSEG